MALTDVAGILSRRFIVGFFLPSFFGIVALKLLVDHRAVPSAVRAQSGGTQLLILGGVAMLLALLLWGLHYPMIRVFEGYWLVAVIRPQRSTPWPEDESHKHRIRTKLRSARGVTHAWVSQRRLNYGTKRQDRWIRDRHRLLEIKSQPAPSKERTRAATDLTTRFPPEDRLVLPTELGNVIRAFEMHPRERYGLDGIAIWPCIEAILSEEERPEIDEVTTDVAFWLNSLFIFGVFGSLLFAERLWHRPGGAISTIAVEIAVVASVSVICAFMYRQLINAAIRWGNPVRAAFDVHRLELFDRLGVRRPGTRDEDIEVGRAITRMLAFGEPLPASLRIEHPPAGTATHRAREHH
jgi:hypothetical protein